LLFYGLFHVGITIITALVCFLLFPNCTEIYVYSNPCASRNLLVLLVHLVLQASLFDHLFHCCESSRDEFIVGITDARLLSVEQTICELTTSEDHFRHLYNSASPHLLVVLRRFTQHQRISVLPRHSLPGNSAFFHPQVVSQLFECDTGSSQLLSHQQAVVF
jgi:hypothetical protein